MLRLTTAGESHGPGITGILEGVPAGLALDVDEIDRELARRQGGYGRGERQAIERDVVEIMAGVRKGVTTGAPLALLVRNRDSRLYETPEVYEPRPGHADLAGHQATGAPIRDVIERASARETAARVAAGAVAKQLLRAFGVEVRGHVSSIGGVSSDMPTPGSPDGFLNAEGSPVRCLDVNAADTMMKVIDEAREAGESLGGVFEVVAYGVPAGLGSYAAPPLRLDSALAGAVMSIPAIKGVEIGDGFVAADLRGSEVHDEIVANPDAGQSAPGSAGARLKASRCSGGFARKTNRAGGIEGGVTNGMPVVVSAAMKPIPTLMKPLDSVDIRTREAVKACKERSDCCAVPAASVVAESVVATVLAGALLDRLGTGGLAELKARFEAMLARLEEEA
jgi:chorismate synthase